MKKVILLTLIVGVLFAFPRVIEATSGFTVSSQDDDYIAFQCRDLEIPTSDYVFIRVDKVLHYDAINFIATTNSGEDISTAEVRYYSFGNDSNYYATTELVEYVPTTTVYSKDIGLLFYNPSANAILEASIHAWFTNN